MIAISETVRQWLGGVDTVHDGIRQQRKRGRPYLYSTTVIIRCYMLMLLYPRVRKHAALQAFLCRHGEARMLVGLDTVFWVYLPSDLQDHKYVCQENQQYAPYLG